MLDDQYIKGLQDEDETCTFYYNIEDVNKRIKSAKENPIIVPEHIKTPEEFCEWSMNYDTTKRS